MFFPYLANYGCAINYLVYMWVYRRGDIILKRRRGSANRAQCHMNKNRSGCVNGSGLGGAVEAPVGDCLGQVRRRDIWRIREIGDGARNL